MTGEITRQSTRGWAGRRARVVAAVVAVVLVGAGVAVALRGNGSDPPAPRSRPTAVGATASTTTGTGSPSPTLSETPEPPALPDAAGAATPAGAVAFFKHFWATYNYGFASLDSQPLRAISASSCTSCTGYADGIDNTRAARAVIAGGEVTVRTAIAAPGDALVGLVVNAVVDQRSASTVSSDGSTGKPVPAKKGLRIDAAVRWRNDQWVMLGMDSKGAD